VKILSTRDLLFPPGYSRLEPGPQESAKVEENLASNFGDPLVKLALQKSLRGEWINILITGTG
jgi:hypothetical protein